MLWFIQSFQPRESKAALLKASEETFKHVAYGWRCFETRRLWPQPPCQRGYARNLHHKCDHLVAPCRPNVATIKGVMRNFTHGTKAISPRIVPRPNPPMPGPKPRSPYRGSGRGPIKVTTWNCFLWTASKNKSWVYQHHREEKHIQFLSNRHKKATSQKERSRKLHFCHFWLPKGPPGQDPAQNCYFPFKICNICCMQNYNGWKAAFVTFLPWKAPCWPFLSLERHVLVVFVFGNWILAISATRKLHFYYFFGDLKKLLARLLFGHFWPSKALFGHFCR